MKMIDAAYQVLHEANEPLHYREIAHRMINQALWETTGKTPHDSVYSCILRDMQKHGEDSRFHRPAPAMFALNNNSATNHGSTIDAIGSAHVRVLRFSFTDAAEYVLDRYGHKQPMHYRDVTNKALAGGLIVTSGKTPESTMYAQIHAEIQRHNRRGERPRFFKEGRGYFGLSRWQGAGLAFQIERHNREVRKKLLERIRANDPVEFEALVGTLLTAIGFEDVVVTNTTGDGGIDVRGTLVVGDAIRTRMAVQVKRWKHNVQAPIVQQVRGSLGAHEQGLIITTSDFSSGARTEAERPDATPVGLMDGEQFVNLLVEHDIGIHRASHDIIELGKEDDEE